MQSMNDSKKTQPNHMDFILKNCLPQQNRLYMQRKSRLAIADANFAKKTLNGGSSNSDMLDPEHTKSNSPILFCLL